MARCTLCGAETSLYDSGQPICIPCSDKQYEKTRERELEALRKRPEVQQEPSGNRDAGQ